jgi:hypothetical protein
VRAVAAGYTVLDRSAFDLAKDLAEAAGHRHPLGAHRWGLCYPTPRRLAESLRWRIWEGLEVENLSPALTSSVPADKVRCRRVGSLDKRIRTEMGNAVVASWE